MAKLSIVAGATSQSVNVKIYVLATGAGQTGFVYNTSGLTAAYSFTGANATSTAITLATLAAVNSAYSSGGFKELDATKQPGVYRFDIPDAALAVAKGRAVNITFTGASGMADCDLEIELTGWNNQIATIDSNVVQLSGDSTAADNAESFFDGTGFAIPGLIERVNTATAGAASTITLDASASTTSNLYRGSKIHLFGGTGAGQERVITAYSSGRVVTVTPAWTTTPDNTTKFAITPAGSANVVAWRDNQPNSLVNSAVPGNVTNWNGAAVASPDTAGYPVVTIKDGTGQGELQLASGVADANMVAVSGTTPPADNLERSASGIVLGTVGAASSTTSIVTSSLDPAAAVIDQFKGRIVTFDRATTTTNLRGQATDITGNTALGVLTVTPLTDAPVSGDTFVIT